MKPIHLILAAIFIVLAFSSSANAYPPSKGGPSEMLSKKSDFEKLKPGDKVVIVCKASNSVTLVDIKDKNQAMQLCAEGKMIHCSDCKKDFKVVWGNPSGKTGVPSYKMSIVNAKGEPCMFMARLK
ncbi:MAG: hypothetical protein WCG52_08445 [bacterium]